WNKARWTHTCFGIGGTTAGGLPVDLSSSGFALVETGPSTGTLTGVFEIPDQFCQQNTKQSTIGQKIKAAYVDFRDVSSNLAEVDAASCISSCPSTTLHPNKDSYLRQVSDDSNQGANPLLQIKSNATNRPVISF